MSAVLLPLAHMVLRPPPPPLPKLPHPHLPVVVNKHAVDIVGTYIILRWKGKVWPTTAAPLLVLLVELHRAGFVAVTREQLSEACQAQGVFGVDSALDVAVERKLITEHVKVLTARERTLPGNANIVARPYYIPSDWLMGFVDAAKAGRAGPILVKALSKRRR